jgi:hypothetical protein
MKSKVVKVFHHESPISGKYSVTVWNGSPAHVSLVAYTSMPPDTMGIVARGYTGVYSESFPVQEELDQLLDDINKTKLATPTEMVHFTWLIRNVTRAWTHQAVRYRIGTAYVQESMRFLGYKGEYGILSAYKDNDDEYVKDMYYESCDFGIRSYVLSKDSGVPDQTARGSLPTNILTSLFWDMPLSTLRHVINTRWCCQAQLDEWLPVLAQMKKLILDRWPELQPMLTAPIDRGENCGFNASFDRPCVWKHRNDKWRIDQVLGPDIVEE